MSRGKGWGWGADASQGGRCQLTKDLFALAFWSQPQKENWWVKLEIRKDCVIKVFRVLFCLFYENCMGKIKSRSRRPARRPLINSVVGDEGKVEGGGSRQRTGH